MLFSTFTDVVFISVILVYDPECCDMYGICFILNSILSFVFWNEFVVIKRSSFSRSTSTKLPLVTWENA